MILLAQKRACALARAASPISLEAGVIREQLNGVSRHGVHVADVCQKSRLSVIDDLGHSAFVGCDGNHLAGHRLQRCKSKRLQLARHQHYIGHAQLLVNAVLLAQEIHLIVNSLVDRQPLGTRALGAIADHQQPRRNFPLHAIENLDDIGYALHRPKIGKMNQDLLVGLGVIGAMLHHLRRALIQIAVHKVRNDLDRRLNVEDLDRPLFEVSRKSK